MLARLTAVEKQGVRAAGAYLDTPQRGPACVCGLRFALSPVYAAFDAGVNVSV
ncbi:MAG: hypothetical protein LBD58_05290 [Treponema sp.]|nr:hypothetical protein [Treponema sp.]